MPAKLPEGEGKRHAVTIRTTRELKEKIEASASVSNRSVAQEIEARVQHSYQIDDWEDQISNTEISKSIDKETDVMLSSIKAAVGAALLYMGDSWKGDIYTRACVRAAIISAMDGTFAKYSLGIEPEQIENSRALQADKFGRLAGRMLAAAQSDPAMRSWISEMAAAASAKEGLNAGDGGSDGEERRSVAIKALIGASS